MYFGSNATCLVPDTFVGLLLCIYFHDKIGLLISAKLSRGGLRCIVVR